MLILTRKTGEEIVIGDEAIIITALPDRRPGQIKIGIQAPDNIPVDRREIYERKKAEAQRGDV